MEEVWPAIVTTIGGIIVAAITVGLPLFVSAKKSNQNYHNEQKEMKNELKKVTSMITELKKNMDGNNRLCVATARSQLANTYETYKNSRKIPESEWRAVCELHEAYKAVHIDGHVPNSWCDEKFEEMKEWNKT